MAGLTKSAAGADEQIVAVSPARSGQSPTSQSAHRQRGFVLIVTAISMTLLLGLAGLGIDIGRMYVIRAELQSFTDAAALTAALELNGTGAGIARARTGAGRLAHGPHAMRWDMGTQSIANIATSFARGSGTPDQASWQEQPKQAGDYRFVRVIATAPAPVIFLRIFQPLTTTNVAAASVAAKTEASVRLIQ
jgi:uncharacterized membrane protein